MRPITTLLSSGALATIIAAAAIAPKIDVAIASPSHINSRKVPDIHHTTMPIDVTAREAPDILRYINGPDHITARVAGRASVRGVPDITKEADEPDVIDRRSAPSIEDPLDGTAA
ncbi:hypothetical protein K458DRAFT_182264 [Lentithecium fluviatile CBS 122367]|uniref:Uncharacterized protein n=1 Tax=Lentithecium fluviatile CBS 122367 TaxID=1168545 RepID=A0A6G1IDT5_9PLEO|nr:hypothetical protein K458DRAFT_182264 [Lentithecium fluviatile CBS 122367]